ncbi:MAG TPA: VCBS repeat-containing protein [Polyangia bacterium]|nr:VCBS repeat-containing protein [Polyangia bacterium]
MGGSATGGMGGQQAAAPQTRADFNHDGFNDFLLGGRALLGAPNGYSMTWALPAPGPGTTAAIYLVAGDLNRDGFTDVVRLDESTSQTPMGLWTPTPIFGGASGFTAGTANTDATNTLAGSMYSYGPAGDVNGDGYADVVVKTRSGAVTLLGGPQGITVGTPPATQTSQAYDAMDGDINGDGYSDAVSNSNGEQAIEQSFGSPTGFGAAPTSVPAQPQLGSLVMLDANSDRFSDVAFTTSDGLQFFTGSSSGLLPAALLSLPGSARAVGSARFNSDSNADVIVTVANALEVHDGTSGGPATAGVPLATPSQWRAGTFLGSFGDVNGDGFDDFTVGVIDSSTDGYNPVSAVLHLGGPNGLDPTGTPAM